MAFLTERSDALREGCLIVTDHPSNLAWEDALERFIINLIKVNVPVTFWFRKLNQHHLAS